jgi:hypothetical protein
MQSLQSVMQATEASRARLDSLDMVFWLLVRRFRSGCRQTRNRGPLAPGWIPSVLGVNLQGEKASRKKAGLRGRSASSPSEKCERLTRFPA